MKIAIDAANIRGGGGLTHLRELLEHAEPGRHGFEKISVRGGARTLTALSDNSKWLEKIHVPDLDRNLFFRLLWKAREIFGVEKLGADLLFVPGGLYFGRARPFVTMCQNMLPFEPDEYRRFGWSEGRIRLLLLRFAQTWLFRRADGVIYVTRYSQEMVSAKIGIGIDRSKFVYHGVDPRFFLKPRNQLPIEKFHVGRPFKFVYVSTINLYKHHGNVAEAIARLRSQGYPVAVDFVGSSYPAALNELNKVLKRIDPNGNFVRCLGVVPYESLHITYAEADGFINASSCEALSIAQLEAMAAGLPVASSSRGPLPEVLGDFGLFFDPESVDDICTAISALLDDPVGRSERAVSAFERAKTFTWQSCADATFGFLSKVHESYRRGRRI